MAGAAPRSASSGEGRQDRDRVHELVGRTKLAFRERVGRVRAGVGLAAQAGLAAALSWWVAANLLHISQPLFAPISAVVTLAASVGQRLRRTVELVTAVSIGIGSGDLLIYLVGTGPWQLGIIVVLAILVGAFIGRSPALVVQAAATAVLIGTLTPSMPNLEFPRFVDALIGGAVALVVTSVLLPLNPLRVINRAGRPALDLLVDQLDATATALQHRDAARAQAALERLRDNKKELAAFKEAAQGAQEASVLSPVHWDSQREAIGRYADAVDAVDRAMRNSGTLIRRAVTVIQDGEAVPPPIPAAVSALADSVRTLRREFTRGAEPAQARQQALRAVCEAGRAYRAGVGFSGSVVVAQVRTAVSDLIVATGVAQDDANDMVRHAFGSLKPSSPTGS